MPLLSHTPPYSTYTTPSQWVVEAELCGIANDLIEVNVNKDTLTISGTKISGHEEVGNQKHKGRKYGNYLLKLKLPRGVGTKESETIASHGVVIVVFKKESFDGPRRLTINSFKLKHHR